MRENIVTIIGLVAFLGVIMMPNTSPAENSSLLGKEIVSRSFPQPISHIVWSSDQSKIAVRGLGEVYLWDVAKDEMVWKIRDGGPSMALHGLAFTPDDNFIVIPSHVSGLPNKPETFAQQTSLTLVSTQDATNKKYFSDHGFWNGFPVAIDFAVAADGSVIAAVLGTQSGWLSLYNPLTGEVIGHVGQMVNQYGNNVNPQKIILDSSRTIISTTNASGQIQIWNYKINKQIVSFSASETGIKTLAFNPISGELITGGNGVVMGAVLQGNGQLAPGGVQDEPGTFLRAWDPLTGRLVRNYRGVRYGISAISVSSDGNYVAAIEGGPLPGVHLLIFDAQEGGLLKSINYGREDGLYAVSFSPDGRRLAVGIGKEMHIYEIN